MDKKILLKEIETLIRSIKLHYDNLENEPRIPTIELELITSKIRKLHEKSIIYNHLHALEEEKMMQSLRQANQALPEISENIPPVQVVQTAVKEEMPELSVKITESIPPAPESTAPPQIDRQLEKQIGMNDRFRYLRGLFQNNSADFDRAFKLLNKAENRESSEKLLAELHSRHAWNKDDETVQDFYHFIRKKVIA